MEINLNVYYGDVKKGSLSFNKGEICVGRDLKCDVIVNDAAVSSRHFSLIINKNRVFVRDEGSVNGTFVNGKQVVKDLEIFPGDRITFCGYTVEPFFEGLNREGDKSKVEQVSNKTMVVNRNDFLKDLQNPSNRRNKKRVVIYSLIALIFVIALVGILLMPSKKPVKKKPVIRIDEIDTYFLTLENTISSQIIDKKSIENAKRFYELGNEKLKMKNLNRDSLYNALIYFLKAKKSIELVNPKPPIWDKLNLNIIKVKIQLKTKLKKLFSDAWLFEQDGNRKQAKEAYSEIMQTLPDESSPIYIKALRRYNFLK